MIQYKNVKKKFDLQHLFTLYSKPFNIILCNIYFKIYITIYLQEKKLKRIW